MSRAEGVASDCDHPKAPDGYCYECRPIDGPLPDPDDEVA